MICELLKDIEDDNERQAAVKALMLLISGGKYGEI